MLGVPLLGVLLGQLLLIDATIIDWLSRFMSSPSFSASFLSWPSLEPAPKTRPTTTRSRSASSSLFRETPTTAPRGRPSRPSGCWTRNRRLSTTTSRKTRSRMSWTRSRLVSSVLSPFPYLGQASTMDWDWSTTFSRNHEQSLPLPFQLWTSY